MVQFFLEVLESFSIKFIPLLGKQVLYSTIVFIIVLPMYYLVGRKVKCLQLALISLVLIRLVLPPNITSPLSGRALLNDFIHKFNLQERTSEQSYIEFSPVIKSSAVQLERDFAHNRRGENQNQQIYFIIFVVYLVGLFITFFLFFMKRQKYHYLLKSSWPVEGVWQDLLRDWQDFFKVKRKIRLVSSDKCASPFTIGILRPILFLPQHIILNEDKVIINTIIAHEMAHIKRLDDF